MTTAFEYRRPSTVAELVSDMAEPGAFALAGGTDLIPLRAAGAIAPALLVDVKHIADLNGVTTEAGTTRIGAATTLADLAEHDDRSLDAILDGARIVGAPQTRTRATLGGNLCRSSPAGDTLCGLLVLDAIADLHSLKGTRQVPIRDFFTAPGRNVATPSEALISIRIPPRHGGSAYHRFTYRRAMDLAIVGVAAWLSFENGTCVDAAMAIGAAAPTPRLVPAAAKALIGTTCDDKAIAQACDQIVAAATPITDVRGTRPHRLRVLKPLARKTLNSAKSRAQST